MQNSKRQEHRGQCLVQCFAHPRAVQVCMVFQYKHASHSSRNGGSRSHFNCVHFQDLAVGGWILHPNFEINLAVFCENMVFASVMCQGGGGACAAGGTAGARPGGVRAAGGGAGGRAPPGPAGADRRLPRTPGAATPSGAGLPGWVPGRPPLPPPGGGGGIHAHRVHLSHVRPCIALP